MIRLIELSEGSFDIRMSIRGMLCVKSPKQPVGYISETAKRCQGIAIAPRIPDQPIQFFRF